MLCAFPHFTHLPFSSSSDQGSSITFCYCSWCRYKSLSGSICSHVPSPHSPPVWWHFPRTNLLTSGSSCSWAISQNHVHEHYETKVFLKQNWVLAWWPHLMLYLEAVHDVQIIFPKLSKEMVCSFSHYFKQLLK